MLSGDIDENACMRKGYSKHYYKVNKKLFDFHFFRLLIFGGVVSSNYTYAFR